MGTLKVNGGLEINSGIFKVGPLNQVKGSGLFPAFINDDSNQGLAYIMAADMSVGQASNADTLDGYHHSSFLKLSGGTMTGCITLASTGIQTNHIAGYYTDQYGNFFHSRSSTGDHWQFHSYDQSISLKYYADLGILNVPALATLNYGSGAPGSGTRGYGHAGAIYYQV